MSNQDTSSKRESKIFVTGATGYIGKVLIEQAVAEGYSVSGLSRNEKGDEYLKKLGATPVRGDLSTLDVIQQESAKADTVLHLAYIHDWSMDYEEILRIDEVAVDAMGKSLRGTGKALVITSGTAIVDPDPEGGETSEDASLSQTFVLKDRIRSERYAIRLAEDDVRVSAIRLPPYVYGHGGSTFVPLLMQEAAKAGESIYIDNGSLRTSTIHVDDAAALFLLAAKSAKAGDVFNGTGSTTITLKSLAETIGEAMKLPVRSVTREEAESIWGQFLVSFVQFENRASNRKAVQELGFQPKGIDMLQDIKSGSYQELARNLGKS